MTKVVILEAPAELLAERSRKGLDKLDETWEGVIHMVPQPTFEHQFLAGFLYRTVYPLAEARGFTAVYETSLFRADDDYRVPDITIARPENVSKRGLEQHAEFVIEVLSPNDESYLKRDFYSGLGVPELVYVDPETRKAELYVLRGSSYTLVSPDEKGVVRSQILGVSFATVDGPKLRLAWASGSAEG